LSVIKRKDLDITYKTIIYTRSLLFLKIGTAILNYKGTLALYPNDSRDWFPLKDQAGEKIIFDRDSSDYDDLYTANSEGKIRLVTGRWHG
jgi:hypothetical protein